jgi:polyribonucleotide nucleotidyltransferase
MVESEAKELSEDVMLGAVMFGHREMQKVINAINELTVEAGTKPSTWTAPAKNAALIAAIQKLRHAALAGLPDPHKGERKTRSPRSRRTRGPR